MVKLMIVLSLLMIFYSCAKNKVINSSELSINMGTDSTLDIVTWNIEYFPKQNDITIDYLVELIDSMNVDIIAMQEIGSESSFASLINKLDGWSGKRSGGGYGLAYLYKSELYINNINEIIELKNYNLTRTPYMLELNWRGQIIYILNNHYKCCGNNIIENIFDDEEFRRQQACLLTKNYLDSNFDDKNVILLGDLNDELTDPDSANIFKPFIEDPAKYKFADIDIAFGSSINWSYPGWPSHLDHILITNELFDEFESPNSKVETIHVEDYFKGGWNEYYNYVSDHRPIVLSLNINP